MKNIYAVSIPYLEALDLSNVLLIQANPQPAFDKVLSVLEDRLEIKNLSVLVNQDYRRSINTRANVIVNPGKRLSHEDRELVDKINALSPSAVFVTVRDAGITSADLLVHQKVTEYYSNILFFLNEITTEGVYFVDLNGCVIEFNDFFNLSTVTLDGENITVTPLITDEEIKALYDTALEAQSIGHIVEIGRDMGGSSCVLGLACKKGKGRKVQSIDIVKLSTVDYIIERNGLTDNINLITGSSPDVANRWPAIVSNTDIGMLFVDGDHTYSGAALDILHWSPYVAKGGYMVLHDIGEIGGVDEAVYHHLYKNPSFGEFRQVGEHMLIARKLS